MIVTHAIHFANIKQDAVLWKAHRVYDDATDPDEKADAIDTLTKMLVQIGNDVKRENYIVSVQKELKIKGRLIAKAVKTERANLERKKKEAIERAKAEQKNLSTEEAGLPDDFSGNIYDALKYAVWEYKGCYHARGQRGDYEITNFTMKILYQTKTGDEQAYRLIAIRSIYGYSHVINMNTDDFVSMGTFRKVIARYGNYVFKGTDADLCRLQEYLQKDEVNAKFIKVLGYQKKGNFWAWANGILPIPKVIGEHPEFIPTDEYGIAQYNGINYFLPATSSLYADKEEQYVNEKKFVYEEAINGFNFEDWAQLFYKVYLDKAVPSMLFYIASLFRDIVMGTLHRFPFLNLFGPPAAGKTYLAESILKMFGEGQEPFNLEGVSTPIGFMRKLAQFKNIPIFMDEYKNSVPTKVVGSLKKVYDGTGYERGKMTNDYATESSPVHGTVIIGGQEMPTQDPALFERCILLTFENGKYSEKQLELSNLLKSTYEDQGISYITSHIIQFRPVIQSKFREEYSRVLAEVRNKVNDKEIKERYLGNIAVLLTFHSLLQPYLHFPFTYAESLSWMIQNMRTQVAIGTGNGDAQRFWEVVEYLFHTDLIKEGRDFEFDGEFLYLRLQNVHPLYMKEMRQRGETNVLAKQSLEHYLKLDKGSFKSVTRKRFADGTNSSAFQMYYKSLHIDLLAIKEVGLSDYQKAIKLDEKRKELGLETDLADDQTLF